MVKDCPLHGHYEDMMAIDSKFLSWMKNSSPDATFPRTTTKTCISMVLDRALRPRVGTDRRPDQPVQHDVRPCFMDATRLAMCMNWAGKRSKKSWTTR